MNNWNRDNGNDNVFATPLEVSSDFKEVSPALNFAWLNVSIHQASCLFQQASAQVLSIYCSEVLGCPLQVLVGLSKGQFSCLLSVEALPCLDRVLHHLLYKYLYELFDKHFIYDSYSCRKGKGTHKAVKRLEKLARKISKNYMGECWSLKMDIKRFFASVDHIILKKLIVMKVKDEGILWLVGNVIDSFNSEEGIGKGIPLGNLTSQIFSNIYLNELDQFVKHKLKMKHYLRYADDFLIITKTVKEYEDIISKIREFLRDSLKLELHPNKVYKRKLSWGIDFCGYIILHHYILPRTKTKRRILKKIKNGTSYQALQSYLGYFSHADTQHISKDLKNHLSIYRKDV